MFPAIGVSGAPSAVGVALNTITGGFPVYLRVIARQFAEALALWDTVPELKSAPRSRRLSARVAIKVLAGQTAREAEEARVLLEKELSERPDDLVSRAQLAWVYLALGRKADALRLSREVADSLTIEMDALFGVGATWISRNRGPGGRTSGGDEQASAPTLDSLHHLYCPFKD